MMRTNQTADVVTFPTRVAAPAARAMSTGMRAATARTANDVDEVDSATDPETTR